MDKSLIKHQFVVDTLQWGLDRLQRVQIEQLRKMQTPIEDAGFDWDRMLMNLQTRAAGIVGHDGQYQLIVGVDKQLRFADMKNLHTRNGAVRKGANARVYNRPTWGVLFGRDDSVYTRLKDGVSDAIRENIMNKMKQAFESSNN